MILVIDIGGSSIKAALTNGNGEVILPNEYPSDGRQGCQALLERLYSIIGQYDNYNHIGISTAGQVDIETGSIVFANENIPGYTGLQLRSLLQEQFHTPVTVENDVNCALLGEAKYGAAKGFKDFICITYGTGIGGAIYIDDKIYRGSNGLAGELGHMTTHSGGIHCACNHYGCYEQYASTTALVKRVTETAPALDNGRIIFEAMKQGNSLIREIIDSWIDEIMIGLRSLIHIFNPPCVVLGGGIMNESYILQRINENIYSQIMPSFSNVVFIKAKLGNYAGLLGAGWLSTQDGRQRNE